MYRHCFFLLLCVCLLDNRRACSQGEPIKFRHITSVDGLSQNHGLCIVRDYKGFMWFGTEDGLNKYNGNKITVYKHNPVDSTTLSFSNITTLLEDADKNLWIGTRKGVNIYNRALDNFKRISLDDSTTNVIIYSIAQDTKKNVWICASSGLYLFDKENKHFIQHLNGVGVTCFLSDAQGNLWVGTRQNGLYLFDQKRETFKNYPHPKILSSILEDAYGNLWVSTWGAGLILFDRKKDTFTTSYTNNANDPLSISSDIIYVTCKDSKGQLWIGTENGGLNLFDPRKGTFKRYVSDICDKYSLSNNSVSAIYEDVVGTIWVGVHRGGINYFNPGMEKFRLYQQTPCPGLSHNNIKSFCEAGDSSIWIATDGGGINILDRYQNTFTYLTNNPIDPRTIGSKVVLSLFEDREGTMWVGTYLEGLSRYDKKSKGFIHYRHNPGDEYSLSNNNVWNIFEDSKGSLWVGTREGGLNRMDRKSGTFTRYVHNGHDDKSLSHNLIYVIYEDSRSNLWIGTEKGLNRHNAAQENFTRFYAGKKPGSLSGDGIRAILEDQAGRFWVGTDNGLNLFDTQTGVTIDVFTTENGLSGNVVQALLEDDNNNIWISTLGGLSKLHYPSRTIRNYFITDGLQGHEFIQNAALKTRDGSMIFGGINGFNFFHPDSVKDNLFIPPIWLTDFYVFNKKVKIGKNSPLEQSITETKEIILSYRESVFTFEFAALNYIFPEKNQYAYKMEGFDAEWSYVGSATTANYTNLNPGEYTFRVRGSNNDGIWNQQGTSIKVIITPPFWLTWWFQSSVVLIIVGSALTFYRARVNAVQKQKEVLKKQVAERTTDLRRANQELTLQKDAILRQRTELELLYTEIKDSVRAAQAIQQSILPAEALIQERFPESFVLNKPKAVIGGDFYWFGVFHEKTVMAVADCTGHGVSGAFMAINSHHLLNQAIYPYRDHLVASNILDRLHSAVIKELRTTKGNDMTRDGMDISLCIFDKGTLQVQFAGANNPLYILRNNEVVQIAPDKFPIGLSLPGKSYTFKNNIVPLQPGDVLYMFSDGYADQFGGEEGEDKFTYGRFRKLLLQIHHEPMAVQKKLLEENLDSWKKDIQQLDDIMVIGIRV